MSPLSKPPTQTQHPYPPPPQSSPQPRKPRTRSPPPLAYSNTHPHQSSPRTLSLPQNLPHPSHPSSHQPQPQPHIINRVQTSPSETQEKKGRSNSFSGFLGKIIPGKRQEKETTYSLRKKWNNESPLDPVSLVFGIVEDGRMGEGTLGVGGRVGLGSYGQEGNRGFEKGDGFGDVVVEPEKGGKGKGIHSMGVLSGCVDQGDVSMARTRKSRGIRDEEQKVCVLGPGKVAGVLHGGDRAGEYNGLYVEFRDFDEGIREERRDVDERGHGNFRLQPAFDCQGLQPDERWKTDDSASREALTKRRFGNVASNVGGRLDYECHALSGGTEEKVRASQTPEVYGRAQDRFTGAGSHTLGAATDQSPTKGRGAGFQEPNSDPTRNGIRNAGNWTSQALENDAYRRRENPKKSPKKESETSSKKIVPRVPEGGQVEYQQRFDGPSNSPFRRRAGEGRRRHSPTGRIISRRLFASPGPKREPALPDEFRIGQNRPKPPQLPEIQVSGFGMRDFSSENEITKAQQIFDDKRAQRQQRRSLRESGDFLGVQGANPRTGYWDISEATTSTDQVSEETRRKLDQQARELAEQKRRYDEAQEMHKAELEQLARKKKEKAERKRREIKMKQRSFGKWKVGENGWNSVVEPDLSPIVQSTVGSPSGEMPPGQHKFPVHGAMGMNPIPSPRQPQKQSGYFEPGAITQPLLPEHRNPFTESESTTPRFLAIPRKAVGSHSRQRSEESTQTVVHNSEPPKSPPMRTTSLVPQQRFPTGSAISPLVQESNSTRRASTPNASPKNHFLGKPILPPETGQPATKATAISYRSVLTNPVQIHPPSDLSRKESQRGSIITSLTDLPPVHLKDPIAAAIPSQASSNSKETPCSLKRSKISSNYRAMKKSLRAQNKSVERMLGRGISSINISTTTTTGSAPLPPLLSRYDGPSDMEPKTRKWSSLPYTLNLIPHRTSSSQPKTKSKTKESNSSGSATSQANTKQNSLQNQESRTPKADNVISSEHHLKGTKERVARLCPTTSPEREERNTRIYTCISPENKPNPTAEAVRNAALIAFQGSNHIGVAEKAEDALVVRRVGNINNNNGVQAKGQGGKGNQSKNNQGSSKPNAEKGKNAGKASASSSSDNKTKSAGRQKQAGTGGTLSPSKKKLPKSASKKPQRTIHQIILGMLLSAWTIVEPVFDAESGIRKRWKEGKLMMGDYAVLVFASVVLAVMAIGGLLGAVIGMKVLGWVVEGLRGIGEVVKGVSRL